MDVIGEMIEQFAKKARLSASLTRGRVMSIESEQMVGRHNHDAWPTCGAWARSVQRACLRKRAVGEDGRPRPRCVQHGGHIKSGKQTPEGRACINAATSARMRAFWDAWRKAGKPALPWRESLRTAKPRPKPPVPKRPVWKDIILTPEEIAFGRKIGLIP